MKRIIRIICLLSMVFLLTGCWDVRELNETGFVTAIGIDSGQSKKLNVSVQIINPSGGSSMLSGGSSNAMSTLSYSAEGDNVFEATRKISKSISRQLHYGHTVLLAISEELARTEGIVHILDGIERDNELRTSASIILTKGTTAEQFLHTGALLDRIGAMKVKRLLNNTEETLGENSDGRLYQVIRTLTSPGREAWINGFKIQDDRGAKYTIADGIGVFRQGTLIGWIDNETSRGVLWTLGKVKSTLISLDYGGEKKNIGIETYRTQAKMKAVSKNGKPVIHIVVKAQANIGEVDADVDVLDPMVIMELEKQANAAIKEEIESSIKKLQEMKSDIYGFGNVIHQDRPKLWKKVAADWTDRTFPTLESVVKVDLHIHRLGLRTNPLIHSMKEQE